MTCSLADDVPSRMFGVDEAKKSGEDGTRQGDKADMTGTAIVVSSLCLI